MQNDFKIKDHLKNHYLSGFGSFYDKLPELMSIDELRTSLITSKDPIITETLLAEIRIRGLVPLEWYDDDVLAYMLQDITPPRLNSGVWVRSVIRDNATCMSFEEITAYLKGDIGLPRLVSEDTIVPTIRKMLSLSIGTVVRHWSDIEIVNFTAFNQRPTKTIRNTYRNSPVREMKTVDQWLDAELLDWLDGYIKQTGLASDEQLLKYCRTKWQLPNDWSKKEVRDWVVDKVEPPITSNGIWVNSQARLDKPVTDWTTKEIVAFALGEIVVPEETVPSLMMEIRTRYIYPTSMSNEAIISNIKDIREDIDSNAVVVMTGSIKEFVTLFNGTTDPKERAIAHTAFCNDLSRCMLLPSDIFKRVWSDMLSTAIQYEAEVFNDVTIFNGFSDMFITKSHRESYTQTLLLIINTMAGDNSIGKIAIARFINNISWNGAKLNLRKYYKV